MKTSSFFHRYKEILLGALMLGLAAFYLYHIQFIRVSRRVAVNSRLIPEILGTIVLVLGVLQVLHGIKYYLDVRRVDRAAGTPASFLNETEKRDVLPIALTFLLIIGYALSFERLGFVISSILCMFCQMLILAPSGKRRPALFLAVSVVVAAVVYFVFRRYLNLMLPPGLLYHLW
ncbi:MAG: tripartite tricarboxylate transporter TctB family protein [Planctomycetes bacterium]|nr:tripartite tricarboxylate transporter TctB family protein [Planctomycetota bacterium]